MEEVKNIYEKLQQCRVELQEMKLKKGGKNKFAGFEYYELADFIPAINKIFLKHKLHSVFNIEKSFNTNNNQYDEVAVLKIINIENPQETEMYSSPTADANLKGCTPIQSLGGVHTYMKRYLYLNALEIVEPDLLDSSIGKDDEKKTTTKAPIKETPKEELATPEQIDILSKQDLKVVEWAKKKFGVNDLKDLPKEAAENIINQMKEKGALK